ncbi:Proteasome assembly chaperone 2 [Eufriesea mexicana]|uniref:Proteasome assembly chaperone 2 n=1 Tax=Eufriesea mexicana TaxID=516756 RepID=A0A310SHC9_9HYME|nr:PREDICTED: proteasome assembly chaperone 2 [Eufriesea mexicana]OAD58174.1 Proteasome assembly chaperone 2 [Eufriesea mexicana]
MIKIPEEINLENYTLILPSVSVGNVGQLCIDLLISTLNLQKIGSLWNSVFLPICGLDPYDKNSSSLCTTADFYLGTYYKLILLQLRSPCVSNSNDFLNELAQFIQEKKIKKAVILTSSYGYEHVNRSDSNVSYLTSDDSLLNDEKLLESLLWKKHMKYIATESVDPYYISGGGFASGLFIHFKSMQIPSTVLFRYCSEGDNVSDALILFQGLNKWLNLIKDSTNNSIKYPPSWEFFFGNPPTSDMY